MTNALKEYQAAQVELQQAQHNFDQADATHVDIAIDALNLAFHRWDVLVRKYSGRSVAANAVDPVQARVAELHGYLASRQLSPTGVDFVLDELIALRREEVRQI